MFIRCVERPLVFVKLTFEQLYTRDEIVGKVCAWES